MSKGVREYLEGYMQKGTIFRDKSVLQPNYTPQDLKHRGEEVDKIAKIMAPCLRVNKPSNLFLYGKTGTGKTLSMIHVSEQIREIAEKNNIPLKIIYINCKLKKVTDTEYRLIAQIGRELGEEIPYTGLPTDEVYKTFYEKIDREKQLLILVLDEIDQLVKKIGDDVLYNLTRINTELKNAQISIVGISNDLVFADNLDPRVKSSLSEEEMVFRPYDALQIQDILKERASLAFEDGVISEGVIGKCAAYAAIDHGDARRAIELLRIASELAERNNESRVEIKHIDEANEKLERDRVVDIVLAQPKQFQATLYSILCIAQSDHGSQAISTGSIYDFYRKLCANTSLRPLTQRRISDIIAELDMFGIINAKITSKGRYGRTREIKLALQNDVIPKIKDILVSDLNLK
ncbi:cell division control protein Cdc6 [Candidatus Woesearchaeota archaeon CG10_big_fil_rev_8_21_14_0_10_44_13]|nr:MAG: cell division control protein Cdc6 [Candidatus Woesearchaeota archaeon CG10_big_fil_rev_8_21_14_0_10_44_13]